jgi:transposase InsO family protein
MKRDLAIRALDMAVALRQPPKDCIHHTDRGAQYCSNEYQKRLKKHGFKVSMSGKGNCQVNQSRAHLAQPMGNKTPSRGNYIPVYQRVL